MTDEKSIHKLPHNIIMEDRKKLSVSGVTDIDSFDEQTIIAYLIGELYPRRTDIYYNVEGMVFQDIEECDYHGGSGISPYCFTEDSYRVWYNRIYIKIFKTSNDIFWLIA